MTPIPRDHWLAALCTEARHVEDAPAAIQARLAAWLQLQLVRREDRRFGQDFARHKPVPGTSPADYQHRVCALPGFGRSLLGIRFRGGDLGWPFVDLLAWEHLPPPDAWAAAIQQIAAEFAPFRPRAVRLLLAEPPPPAVRAEPDLLWIAGTLSALAAAPPPVGLRARAARADDAAHVARAYAVIPEALRPHLSPAGAEELKPPAVAVCLEAADGAWVGLAAAQPQQRWAFVGYEVVEEVLAPDWRGRGLGRVLQQALIAALQQQGTAAKTLFGTIHADNAPSLGTARGCGRREVARWWMVPTDSGY